MPSHLLARRPFRHVRSAALLVAMGLAPLTTMISCSSGNRELDPERRAAAAPVDADAYAALGYRLEWRGFPRMTAGSRVQFFNVMGDVIGVQESASVLSLLDTSSGATRWSDQLANPLTKFVGLTRDESRVISSSESEAFFLALETGTLVDKHRLEKVATTRPLLAGNILVYGTATGEIMGVLADRGFRLWGNSVRGAIEVEPVFVGEFVGVVSQTGDVLFFDPATGSGVARNKISGGVATPGGALSASETTMFVASMDQSLYAFDARSGLQLWRKRTDTPIRTAPVYHEGVVYLDTPGQGMTAYDAASGREVWSNADAKGKIVGVRNGRLIAWDRASETAATLSIESGEVIDRVRLRGVAFMEPTRFVDGQLFTASSNGVVSKFVPRS